MDEANINPVVDGSSKKDVEYVGSGGPTKTVCYMFSAVALTSLISAVALINSIIGVTDHATCSSTVIREVDNGKGEISKDKDMSIVDGPCGSYDNFFYVSPDAYWTFCDAVLREDTAYILTDHINCNGLSGPTLASNSCLDCRGLLIRGQGKHGYDYDSSDAGLQFLETTKNARAHNCIVEGFSVGISIKGDSNSISNVETTNNRYGISSSHSAGHNHVTCSVSRNNYYSGMDIAGSIEITGSLIESNKKDEGIAVSESAVVSCSEIRSDKIKISGDGDRQIQNSIAPSIEFAESASGTTILDNVALCGDVIEDGNSHYEGGGFDDSSEYWGETQEREETIQSENLMCNEGALPDYAEVSCDRPCPADLSLVSLPLECAEVCPVKRGTYIPI